MKTLLLITLTTGTLLLNSPGIAQEFSAQESQSSRVLEKARSQNTLKWGLRVDALSVSRTNGAGKLTGFCSELIDLLEKYLKQEKLVQKEFKINRDKIDSVERFKSTQQKKFDGECGSDSIRKDIPGIIFSKTFVRTPTKILSKKSKDDKFTSEREKPIIGIVIGSTTEKRVKSYYDINDVREYLNRDLAVAALISDEIDGFANDEIILKSMLKETEYAKPGLYIRPEKIGNENYGLVLPDDDQKWVLIINNFLNDKSDEIERLRKKHFDNEESINWISILITLLVFTSFGSIYRVRLRNSAQEQKPNPDPKTNTFGHGYALLIGVGKAAYSRWSLPVTVKDVQALNEVLVNPDFCAYPNNPEHIRLLHNEGATRSKILEALNWLKEQVQTDPDATVIVYYSGHGWLNQSQNRYYLVPHDINPFNLESSALSADEFTDALRQIKSERLLVIIDSCHAAGMATAKHSPSGFEETPVPKSVIDNLKQGKGRVVFTSSQGEQSSWIRPDRQMSIYTYHLIEALKGKGNQPDENVVKISHLMRYLSEKVPESAFTMCNEEQTPYFSVEAADFHVALLKSHRPNRVTRGLKSLTDEDVTLAR